MAEGPTGKGRWQFSLAGLLVLPVVVGLWIWAWAVLGSESAHPMEQVGATIVMSFSVFVGVVGYVAIVVVWCEAVAKNSGGEKRKWGGR